jgi:RNA polymerase II subunit A C-terminal domain phosphatase SSU72
MSNNNRSMAAHKKLADAGFTVGSYGTWREVRMPGPSQDQPQVFKFGTSYEDMYQKLLKQDEHLYTQNGCLPMLNRNRAVKLCPQRFQESSNEYDIVITFEKRVFDMVVEDLCSRASSFKPVQVINLETKDRREEAEIGADQCLEFCSTVRSI